MVDTPKQIAGVISKISISLNAGCSAVEGYRKLENRCSYCPRSPNSILKNMLTVQEIRSSLQIALLGMIYPKVRAIVFSYSRPRKSFCLRYYFESEPSEEDFEVVNEVVTEFISNFKFSEFEIIKGECEYSSQPLEIIDPLDGFVYARKE